MKHARLLLPALAMLCLLSAPIGQTPKSLSAAQDRSEKKEAKVWVNTHSGVYHCPGSRWYGVTKKGKYMSECEAQKVGYRPAYGKPCGSDCK